MSVREHPRKADWWIIDYYPDGRGGKRERIPFKGSYEDALVMEQELLEARANPPVAPIGLPPLISKLAPEYLMWAANHLAPTTVSGIETALELYLLPFFGNHRPHHLAQALVESYKAKRLEDKVKKRTINKELSYFSGLLKWALKQGKISALPLKIEGFPTKQTLPPAPRLPERTEIESLIGHMKGDAKWLVSLLFLCGLRRSEAFGLQGHNVAQSGKLLIVVGKGGKERIIPVPPELQGELQSRSVSVGQHGLLFPSPKTGKKRDNIRRSLITAAKKAGIQVRVYHHLMRHGYGTHAIAAGVPQRIVQSAMGHTSPATTDKYTHLAGAHLSRAFEPFTGKVDDGPPPPENMDGAGI
ncbi:tyrosine-type recombinase/integrase [Geobacter pickeringii]|uniref:Integrase n=1 Tax=Geobacter pickeringii TaxID=345632 RepID=A0A0B5BC66_9BACT|nr:tyrosine-type recombinase/integrase [Geobacter pickeringii]AJE02140.1 hypothetical protein GPICK_00970 [Geobacter pickeringii]